MHDAGLRIDSEHFLRRLREDDGLLVGRLDVRVTGPLLPAYPESRPPAADDPALGMRGSNVIRSATIGEYLRHEIGAPVDDDYIALSLELNFAWDWRPPHRTPPEFHTAMTKNLGVVHQARPSARMLLLGGYFDLASTLSSAIHAVRHSGVPDDRLRIHTLVAGHSLDTTVLAEAHDAVATMIREASRKGNNL